jgi:hypothetical protein
MHEPDGHTNPWPPTLTWGSALGLLHLLRHMGGCDDQVVDWPARFNMPLMLPLSGRLQVAPGQQQHAARCPWQQRQHLLLDLTPQRCHHAAGHHSWGTVRVHQPVCQHTCVAAAWLCAVVVGPGQAGGQQGAATRAPQEGGPHPRLRPLQQQHQQPACRCKAAMVAKGEGAHCYLQLLECDRRQLRAALGQLHARVRQQRPLQVELLHFHLACHLPTRLPRRFARVASGCLPGWFVVRCW